MPDILDNREGDEERPQKKKRKLINCQENNSGQDLNIIKVLTSYRALSKFIVTMCTFLLFTRIKCLWNFWVNYFSFMFPEPFGFIHWINHPAPGWNWIKAAVLGCYMQGSWTQTWQHGTPYQDSYPGSHGCRITSRCHSNLEQSAMVSSPFGHCIFSIAG